MTQETFPLDAYMARIGYAGPVKASEGVLEAVQRAQLATVPFENFDILLGRGVSLEPAALCQKLIHSWRGGYCFELNTLFLMALEAMGFEVRPLLARVHLSGRPSGRTHELLLVTLRGRQWIADAGFGGPSLRAPIPLELDTLRSQDGRCYRLSDAGPFGAMLQTRKDEPWRDLYSFDLSHVDAADIALGNHFTSTHPSSHFTFSRVAALHTPSGRTTLLDRTLRRVAGDGEQTQELPEGQEFVDALERHFGIELGVAYEALRPLQVKRADQTSS